MACAAAGTSARACSMLGCDNRLHRLISRGIARVGMWLTMCLKHGLRVAQIRAAAAEHARRSAEAAKAQLEEQRNIAARLLVSWPHLTCHSSRRCMGMLFAYVRGFSGVARRQQSPALCHAVAQTGGRTHHGRVSCPSTRLSTPDCKQGAVRVLPMSASQMRAAEQAEERRRAAEQAAVSARAQEQARKAAAAEERRQKLEAEVQVRVLAGSRR